MEAIAFEGTGLAGAESGPVPCAVLFVSHVLQFARESTCARVTDEQAETSGRLSHGPGAQAVMMGRDGIHIGSTDCRVGRRERHEL